MTSAEKTTGGPGKYFQVSAKPTNCRKKNNQGSEPVAAGYLRANSQVQRYKGSEHEIHGGEESESTIKASESVGSAWLELNIVHGGHYRLAFGRRRNKFQETDGVADRK